VDTAGDQRRDTVLERGADMSVSKHRVFVACMQERADAGKREHFGSLSKSPKPPSLFAIIAKSLFDFRTSDVFARRVIRFFPL
jgi:hypothetical protein